MVIMEFLRKMAREAAMGFKDTADSVWDELGDIKGVPQAYKDVSRSAGKYALTAQLLMILNFPDNAEMFRDTFNTTNKGPTGAHGFSNTPIGNLLNGVSELSMQNNASAIGSQGYADVTQTSTYEDLERMLPQLDALATKSPKKGSK